MNDNVSSPRLAYGLSVCLESGSEDKLSSPVKQYIQNLLKYGSEWPAEEKVQRRDMVGRLMDCAGFRRPFVGFVHYRVTLEEDDPVLYVYEIQLESRVQGKGSGEFLMQLIELIACKANTVNPLEFLTPLSFRH
ncbi:N-alpha-acetyltransferase 40-like isoform X2 [Tripterygium wilfordii]|uniref:N-alpha-acetyltransferase 40-like isoform X2 n=1 Tax=Tripterygium wilfordii TaxID=458696 RepID=UPI0018F7F3D4|nr:N-alpha-acetyltransferase 40-like isoform X2 [Tripterygium wilfordii]XP_038688271.1 N-alpha-acetyltransferase 40-like isoform X2 [Tripterygium wilfordii]